MKNLIIKVFLPGPAFHTCCISSLVTIPVVNFLGKKCQFMTIILFAKYNLKVQILLKLTYYYSKDTQTDVYTV